jgi:hypothetical protein
MGKSPLTHAGRFRCVTELSGPTLWNLLTKDFLIASWCKLSGLECDTCTIRSNSDKNRASSERK